MKIFKHVVLIVALATNLAVTAEAQNLADSTLGNAASTYRADDIPAGDAGRYYQAGSALAKDNIYPSSFSQRFRVDANFKANWNLSCGNLDFYQNIQAEIKNLQYRLKNTVKNAQKAILTSISSAISSYFQYLLNKINPTLGQLSMKQLDEYIELFDLKVKSCQDYEKDVKNGQNPLSEIVQIAVGEQWKTAIGMVNSGQVALEEAEEELLEQAKKNGVQMADGKRYGGENQDPINITQSLLKAGMNLILARGDKNQWDNDFTVNANTVKNNPILGEFKNPKALYEFVTDIYGATEKRISQTGANNTSVKTTAGRGYEKTYAEYRNTIYTQLQHYVNRDIDRKAFESATGILIPPAEISDIRLLPPYQKAVAIEERAQQYAIKRVKDNLIFAKQALKTGIYAPDMQQSGMKGIALEEYKSIYYRILDDLAEITQRAYQ